MTQLLFAVLQHSETFPKHHDAFKAFKRGLAVTFASSLSTCESAGKLLPTYGVTLGLGRCRSSIKAGQTPHSLSHFSRLHLLGNQVHLPPSDMSCYNPCVPCQPSGPAPLASSCSEPCVRQCQDSIVVIQPSAVVVTLPGPILSSFPQSTAVGSSTSAAVGSILSSQGVPISSGGFSLSGIGGRYGGSRCLPC
ncbi:feather beta keratin-like [Rhea pennata]|uniref:feather beta keratin-like n=1 Tax=Rhea pennata TaxID=8795 RepID=UPI002E272323